MNSYPTTSAVQKIMTLLGVILFCYLVNTYSQISFISNYLAFLNPPSRGAIFERHFWQFMFGFIAIGFLSRGHLWSYGINSQNLKVSMKWLMWVYSAVFIVTFLIRISGGELLPIRSDEMPGNAKETVIALLIYWMSSPVANQILFFGFAQTILLKQFGDTNKIAGIPFVIFISALLFMFYGIETTFAIGRLSLIVSFAVGIYSGFVYWKTNSLIAPMLAHAFVFGFPLVAELCSLAFTQ